jgi:hypothetical protein
LEKPDHYTISQSHPAQSQHETVQFSVKREGYNEDIMRVDSYKEGYYSAFWHSSATISQFLTAAEEFLSHTDNSDKKAPSPANFDDEHTVQIFTLDEDHTDWSYTRPLTEQDLRESAAIPNDPQNLYLLRVNSPKASFCYEAAQKVIGVIAVPEQDTQSKIMQATASFAHKTQPALSEELVTSVLNRLPYNP